MKRKKGALFYTYISVLQVLVVKVYAIVHKAYRDILSSNILMVAKITGGERAYKERSE